MSKVAHALEGGLAGATTLSLLSNTLKKIDKGTAQKDFFSGKNLPRRLKKASRKKPAKAIQQYIGLAGDLLGSSAFLGLAPLGKKKNALLRGALLGTAAGLGAVLLRNDDETDPLRGDDTLLSKVFEVSLYTIGGLIAGKVIERSRGTKRRRKRK